MSLHAFTSNARQYISKRSVNRESHSALLGRLIFLYHLEHQMVQIPPWLHSTFKYLSNEYSHAQIRVKMKKLWPRQVGEEKQAAVRKYVATRSMSRQEVCRDQCRDKQYVTTSVATSSMSQPVSRQAVCRDRCRDKQYKATGVATSSMSRPVSRQAVCRDRCRDKQYVATGVATSSMSRPVSRPNKLSRPVSRPESFVATRKLCRNQNCCRNLKKSKFDILTKFQAHFTLGPYICSFF